MRATAQGADPEVMSYDNLRAGRRSASQSIYSITTCISARRRQLVRPRYCAIVADAMAFAEISGAAVNLVWVLMPDHVHWLFQLIGTQPLSVVVGSMKSFSSRPIGIGEFWQRGYFDHQLRTNEALRTHARYLTENPLRAGLVTNIAEYPWWFARWEPPPRGRGEGMQRIDLSGMLW